MILFVVTIAMASSTDCFASGLSYGCNKIFIPLKSVLIIVAVCTITFVVSLIAGDYVVQFVDKDYAKTVGAIVLLFLGAYKLTSYTIKALTSKKQLDSQLKFSLFSLNFIVTICNQPEKADLDDNKSISCFESVFLAVALSLDGIAMGVSIGLGTTTFAFVGALTTVLLVSTFASLKVGVFIGRQLTKKTTLNLSWLSGVLLIGLALFNILN